MKPYIKILGVGLCASMFMGCSSVYYTDIGITQVSNEENQKLDDASLSKKLNGFIEKKYPNSEVKAIADHYNVLLVGQVNSNDAKTALANLVKNQNEVKKVFDYTSISSEPKLKYNSSITSDAKDRIATEYNIDPRQVTIIAVDNVVYAMGTNIGDLTNLKTALDGVAAMPHVRKVVNLVQPGTDDYLSVK